MTVIDETARDFQAEALELARGDGGVRRWERLCRLLESLTDPQIDDIALELELGLSDWDDTLRVAPLRWVQDAERTGEIRKFWDFVRVLEMPDWDAPAVLRMPLMNGIVRLDMSGWESTCLQALDALTSSDHVDSLEWLDLTGCSLGPEGLERLGHPKFSERLKGLWLGENELGVEGAGLLCEHSFAALERLDLQFNEIGDAGMSALGGSRCLETVRRLDVSGNEITDLGLRMFVRRGAAHMAHTLLFDCNGVKAAGLESLGSSAHIPNLRSLSLVQNPLGDEGAVSLAEAARLSGLETLHLDDCAVGSDGIAALAGSPNARGLAHLSLCGNPLGDAGLEAMVRSEELKVLGSLALHKCEITAEGARCLGASSLLEDLEELVFSMNLGASELIEEMSRRKKLRLVALSLGRGGIVGDDVALLGRCRGLTGLRKLDLRRNKIGLKGASALAKSNVFSRLEILRIPGCEIGDKGAVVLADSPNLRSLKWLDVDIDKDFGTDGALAFARSPYLPEALKTPFLRRLKSVGWKGENASQPQSLWQKLVRVVRKG